jgi:aminoglycoside phosphotransferase (APT) family kinase protein
MNDIWGTLRPWVESALAAEVLDVTRLAAGNSRTTWKTVVRNVSGDIRAYVVRYEGGTGPLSGTPFSLRREQVVYEAVAGRGIAVPLLRAVSPAGDALITDWADGADRWEPQLLGPYLRELGQLHSIEVGELALPGFAASSRADIDLWWAVHQQKARSASPYVELAYDVLVEHHPGEANTVLCHGDAGPANFLHDGERVTALLDWEFSHLGDPHDDLAWVAVRAWMFGVQIPDFATEVRRSYASHAPDVVLDPGRLDYWKAVVLMRSLIVVLSAIENGQPGSRFVHLSLRPTLEWALMQQVARVAGLTLPQLPEVGAVGRRSGQDVITEIALGLAELLPSVADDQDATRRVKLMRRLADQLAMTWNIDALLAPPALPGADLEERVHSLAGAAAVGLSLLPRSARMARTPLPAL